MENAQPILQPSIRRKTARAASGEISFLLTGEKFRQGMKDALRLRVAGVTFCGPRTKKRWPGGFV